jgi:hypothetical protein
VLTSEALTWWEHRRLRYNIGLVMGGLLAFVGYVGVVDGDISTNASPCTKITLFATVFQGIGFLGMVAVASVCYLAGPLCESIIKPLNIDRFRRVTFQIGFWFSVLLPSAIPVVVASSYLIHPAMAPVPCEP